MNTAGKEPIQVKFEDPDHFTQGERLRQILSARERCSDIRVRSMEYALLGNLTEEHALSIYREAIEDYIMQLTPLVGEDSSDEVIEVWTELPIGTIEVRPPAERTSNGTYLLKNKSNGREIKREYHSINPEKHTVDVYGLYSILELPKTIDRDFECVETHPVNGLQTENRTFKQPVPRNILDQYLMVADNFRAMVGLDLDLTDRPFNDYS